MPMSLALWVSCGGKRSQEQVRLHQANLLFSYSERTETLPSMFSCPSSTIMAGDPGGKATSSVGLIYCGFLPAWLTAYLLIAIQTRRGIVCEVQETYLPFHNSLLIFQYSTNNTVHFITLPVPTQTWPRLDLDFQGLACSGSKWPYWNVSISHPSSSPSSADTPTEWVWS
jgi:hypothetical protein